MCFLVIFAVAADGVDRISGVIDLSMVSNLEGGVVNNLLLFRTAEGEVDTITLETFNKELVGILLELWPKRLFFFEPISKLGTLNGE